MTTKNPLTGTQLIYLSSFLFLADSAGALGALPGCFPGVRRRACADLSHSLAGRAVMSPVSPPDFACNPLLDPGVVVVRVASPPPTLSLSDEYSDISVEIAYTNKDEKLFEQNANEIV